MPVHYGHIPAYGCNWMSLTGKVACEDALAFAAGFDPSRPDMSLIWIVYVDDRADVSEITADCMRDLHKAMKPLAQRLAQKGTINVVWACEARLNLTFVSAWRAYLNADPDYPSNPRSARSLIDACRLAGVDEAAADAILMAVAEATTP